MYRKQSFSSFAKLSTCISIFLYFGCSTYLCRAHFTPNDHLSELISQLSSGNASIGRNELQILLNALNLNSTHSTHDNSSDHEHDHTNEGNSDVKSPKCFTAEDMFNFFPNETSRLDVKGLGQLLPTIVYSIYTDACHQKDQHNHEHEDSNYEITWQVILACVCAVLVISISGLAVVGLVPFMPRRFYNVTTQFLIALAIGSLTGDAFLHLIPHALSGGHHDHHVNDPAALAAHQSQHQDNILKSLVGVLGIYLFFVTDRMIILCQNKKSRHKEKRKMMNLAKSQLPDEGYSEDNQVTDDEYDKRNLENGPQLVAAGAGGSPSNDAFTINYTNGMSSYEESAPPVLGSIGKKRTRGDRSDYLGAANAVNTERTRPTGRAQSTPAVDQHCIIENETINLCNHPPHPPMNNTHCADHLGAHTCVAQSSKCAVPRNGVDLEAPGPSVKNSSDTGEYQANNKTTNAGTAMASTIAEFNNVETREKDVSFVRPNRTTTTVTSNLRGGEEHVTNMSPADRPAHPHRNKPHGHHHGHSHDLSSVRAIAYTVVVGDGLHNFGDGIAIGAAFAADFRGGLSTAIAVLCHELPHELGDFAVLLHAGMSVKAALLYNLLSSLLCAGGATIGMLLGRLESVNAWLFMLTAGMFVYIALVNMMPELATNRLKGSRLCHRPSVLFFWQNSGVLLGFGIMLVIAFYEGHMA